MYELLGTKGKARRGRFTTSHGTLETPFFMPIATKGAVKSLSNQDLLDIGAQLLLSNTYHLMLRPGEERMNALGGLHTFMGWEKPILTDSGGYQVFSLAKMNKTTEDGVTFRSHIDGARVHLTPEGSMQMQHAIGSDIVMQFDDVAAGKSSYQRYKEAMERSLRWAKRCKESLPRDKSQLLFGIVQGGTHEDLRRHSAEGLMDIGFDGYAIGGLSVGEDQEDTFAMTDVVADILPADKPRYFMGGGLPEEILYYVKAGVDMFDCVIPTRNARHGTLFVWNQHPDDIDWENPGAFYSRMLVTNSEHATSQIPLDPFVNHAHLSGVTRAYMRHLFASKEMLGFRYATLHNLHFYFTLMRSLRTWIAS